MNAKDVLNREFSSQNFVDDKFCDQVLMKYRDVADNYARVENAIAVLSDLREKVSYLYCGGFSRMLKDFVGQTDYKIPSIWEEAIFKLIHPDDLLLKHTNELCFFHFIKRQAKKKRGNFYMISKLRMLGVKNCYIPVLHRLFYIPFGSDDTLRLALCLYSPLSFDISMKGAIVDSVNGNITQITQQYKDNILSIREKQVLSLIDKGLTSKEISEDLFISKNTVSRHRQEILCKLQARNSIEACRKAKDLELI